MEMSPSSAAPGRAARGYGHVHRSALVDNASPHELVRLMLDGAVASLGAAEAMDPGLPGDRDARRRAIDRTMGFVHELQGSLRDPDTDELSGRLFALYGFVGTQLMEPATTNAPDRLRAARDVLVPLAEAWRAIAPEAAAVDAGRSAS